MNRSKLFRLIGGVALIGALAFVVMQSVELEPNAQIEDSQTSSPYHFQAVSPKGKIVSLGAYSGKVVLVDFWATWCPPCILEVPHFKALQRKYKKRGFQIVAVSQDDSVKDVKDFQKKYRLNYPVVMQTEAIRNAYTQVRSLPTAYLLDRNHQLITVITGYKSQEEFEALIEPHL